MAAEKGSIVLSSSSDLGTLTKSSFPIEISVIKSAGFDGYGIEAYSGPKEENKMIGIFSETSNYDTILSISYEAIKDYLLIDQNNTLYFYIEGDTGYVTVKFFYKGTCELFIGSSNGIAKKIKEMFIGVPLKLPDEYQQVKYLESTGTQWIDTGVPAFSKNRTEIDLQFTDLTKTSYNGYGRMIDVGSDNHNIGAYWSGSGEKVFLWQSIGTGGRTQTADTNRHIFFLDNNNEECGLDNIIVSTDYCYNESSYQEGETLHLFAMKWYDLLDDQMLIKWKAYEKVYGAKYYLEGILVRDFIPCIRKSDNKPGMYDLVNNQFYINQGTEEFLIGEKITSARKVKKAFIGINGIARKVFEASPSIINFTIEGISYQAKEGMTWNEWVFSEYNDINVYTTSEPYIVSNGTNSAICLEDGTFVALEDIIIKNYSYSQQLTGSMPGY